VPIFTLLCRELGHDLLVSETSCGLALSHGLDLTVAMRDRITLRGRGEPIGVCALADRT